MNWGTMGFMRTGTHRPQLRLDRQGPDGNVYVVIGKCADALRKAGCAAEAVKLKQLALQARSYDEVLKLCETYVDVTWIR